MDMSEPFLKTGEREESKAESVLSGIEEQQREALRSIREIASLEVLEEFLRGKNGVHIHTKTLPGWRDLTKKDKEELRRTADIAWRLSKHDAPNFLPENQTAMETQRTKRCFAGAP